MVTLYKHGNVWSLLKSFSVLVLLIMHKLAYCFYHIQHINDSHLSATPPVLPIPVVVITGGARHDYYLIRASFDQSHPHYNSIKA